MYNDVPPPALLGITHKENQFSLFILSLPLCWVLKRAQIYVSYSRKQKPLKMIYFAISINIKDIFPATTRRKKRSKKARNSLALRAQINSRTARSCSERIKNTKALWRLIFYSIRHMPSYANECESVNRLENMLCIWCWLPNHLEFFFRQIYDSVCAAIESYCFCEIKMLMHSIILCCCWGFLRPAYRQRTLTDKKKVPHLF